jgi:hypothetical protein
MGDHPAIAHNDHRLNAEEKARDRGSGKRKAHGGYGSPCHRGPGRALRQLWHTGRRVPVRVPCRDHRGGDFASGRDLHSRRTQPVRDFLRRGCLRRERHSRYVALAGARVNVSDELEVNPQLRDLLTVARSWGVSPSRFAGIEPVRRTVYTYGHDGQLLSSVTTTDPEWTEEDREMALRLFEYEKSLCGGCGHPLSETTDPHNEFAYGPASPPIRCHRCTAVEIESDRHQEKPHPGALHIPIVLRERST